MAWDKTRCEEGILAPDLNDAIRAQYADLEAALTKEHLFSTGETPDTNQGHHRQGSARCYFQDAAPTTRINGDAFTSADLGSLWIDTNSSPDNQFNILTATTPTWTPISTEIIATLLASARTFAAAVTFDVAAILSKAPTLTEGIVANNSYLQARNATDDGNVDLIKADGSNVPTLPDASALATSAAPTEDAQLANAKYVDDNVGSANYTPTDYAGDGSGDGRESITFPNGLILKMGLQNVAANTLDDVTYDTAFPNGFVSAFATSKSTTSHGSDVHVFPKSGSEKTILQVRNNDGAAALDIYWQAWGY